MVLHVVERINQVYDHDDVIMCNNNDYEIFNTLIRRYLSTNWNNPDKYVYCGLDCKGTDHWVHHAVKHLSDTFDQIEIPTDITSSRYINMMKVVDFLILDIQKSIDVWYVTNNRVSYQLPCRCNLCDTYFIPHPITVYGRIEDVHQESKDMSLLFSNTTDNPIVQCPNCNEKYQLWIYNQSSYNQLILNPYPKSPCSEYMATGIKLDVVDVNDERYHYKVLDGHLRIPFNNQ